MATLEPLSLPKLVGSSPDRSGFMVLRMVDIVGDNSALDVV